MGMMMGVNEDARQAATPIFFGASDSDKAAAKEALPGKVSPLLKGVEGILSKGTGPFLYTRESEGPCLGDLALFDTVTGTPLGLLAMGVDLSPYPKITACVDAVKATATGDLKAHIAKG